MGQHWASPPPLNPPHKSFYLTKPSYHRSTFAELDGHNCEAARNGPERSAGRAVRGRSGAQRNAGREPWPQRAQARRSASARSSGAGTGAPSPERSATRSGTAFKRWSAAAASVQAFQRDVFSVTARLSKRSRAARSLASARPCGPGRRERKRPQPQGDQRERARRPAATAPSVSDCRGYCGG